MSDTVQNMLERAKLPVTSEELERLQRNYSVVEGWLEDCRFDEARASEPAAIYRLPTTDS